MPHRVFQAEFEAVPRKRRPRAWEWHRIYSPQVEIRVLIQPKWNAVDVGSSRKRGSQHRGIGKVERIDTSLLFTTDRRLESKRRTVHYDLRLRTPSRWI